MKLKPYQKYKDSGIQWIGEIPEGWDPIRLKYLLNRIDPGCWGSDFDEKGTIILRSTEIKVDGSWQIDDPATRSITEKERSNCLLKEGDLLVTKSSGSEKHIGKTALVNKDIEKLNCCFSNFMTRLRPDRNQKSKILHYFLNSDNARSQFNYFSNSTVGLGNLNEDCFKNLIFVKIPLDEQVEIQIFLDKKTAKIDAMIEKDKKLIALLKEKRTALINHVVTKGLDPNAKIKDSGIEWIGEIPEGWEVHKLKYKTIINKKKLEDDINPNYVINYLDISNVDSSGNILDIEEQIFEDAPSRARRIPRSGDTILSTVRTYLKAIAYLENIPGNLIVSTGFAVLEPIKSINSKYLFYSTSSEVFIQNVIAYSKGVAYPAINPPELGQIPIIMPSLPEQTTIVNFLDKATAKIDKTIQKIEQKINLLEEYKKSLIHHVVIGKVDVRGVEA